MGTAASIVARTVPELTDLSDTVVEADVMSSQSYREADGRIYTQTTLKVLEYLKGEGPEELVVSQLGGTVGDLRMEIPGDLELVQGQRVVLFARSDQGQLWPTLLGWSAFVVTGQGPEAAVSRPPADLALYRHSPEGVLQVLERGSFTGPTTLRELRDEIREGGSR